jgi:acylphosphatase
VRRIAFVVTGRVQGVGFRRFAQRSAEALGIAGQVRNLADGSVIGEAEGEDEALESFLAALRRGPALSRVAAVQATPVPTAGSVGFEIR